MKPSCTKTLNTELILVYYVLMMNAPKIYLLLITFYCDLEDTDRADSILFVL